MKFLSIAGTLAMFLVGGGILVHGISFLHHEVEDLAHLTGIFESITTMLLNALVGLAVGVIVVAIVTMIDRKSTRLNSSHVSISYAVFCLKKKNKIILKEQTNTMLK